MNSLSDFNGPLDVLVAELSNSGVSGASSAVSEIDKLRTQAANLQNEVTRLRAEAAAVARQAGSLVGFTGDPSSLVEYIEIESAYGPKIHLDGPLAPHQPAPGPSLLEQIKPRMTIKIKGMAPWVVEPYGKPGITKWPWVLFAAGAVIGAAGGGVIFGRLGAIGGGIAGGLVLREIGSKVG